MRLVDNRFGNDAACLSPDVSEEQISLLKEYSGKEVSDILSAQNSHVRILGDSAGMTEDEHSLPLYSLRENGESMCIDTGNIMGVLRLRDPKMETSITVEVTSRFDSADKQYFLDYLLSRVMQVSFADLVEAGTNGLWDVLLAMQFARCLAQAREIGLYKEYRRFECNDLDFRGRLDLARHIRLNVPLGGRLAYTKREQTHDVPLNHLFRAAAEKVYRKWPGLLTCDKAANEMLQLLRQNTQPWSSSHISETLRERAVRETVRHPFFVAHYEQLRQLSLMLLEDGGFSVYDGGDAEVSGVLFSGAWLWEEYLAKILEPIGYVHAICGTDTGKRRLFSSLPGDFGSEYRGSVFPDFYRKSDGGSVLDAKYKSAKAKREDVLQVLAYALNTGASRVGLLFPPTEGGRDFTSGDVCHGFGSQRRIVWQSFGYNRVARYDNPDDFLDYMWGQEQALRDFASSR